MPTMELDPLETSCRADWPIQNTYSNFLIDSVIYARNDSDPMFETDYEQKKRDYELFSMTNENSNELPIIHIKDETDDDEYIDVVNYFDSENSKISHHDYYHDIHSNGNYFGEKDEPERNSPKDQIDNTQRTTEDPVTETREPMAGRHVGREEIKILKPEEINKDFEKQNADKPQADNQRYKLLKQQLSSEPLGKDIVISRNLNNQIEKQLQSSTLNKQRTTTDNVSHQPITSVENDVILPACCDFNHEYQPYVIHKELSGGMEMLPKYCVEDMTLRYRVVVLLWVLLGERRLIKVGYPSEAIHVVLWRVVHLCCSVTGVKSAAAVPLPPTHDCQGDMLCFRDHVHRFLEICAPTRDHWKLFGWSSLTVDAVLHKIYKEDLLPSLVQHSIKIPVAVRMAMCKLSTLERAVDLARQPNTPPSRWKTSERTLPTEERIETEQTDHVMRPVMVEKKKRGRPLKLNRVVPDSAGKIERVMLWRFVLNLLEEPGNAACIHWLNRDEGIFRILNTDWLARIWGRRHGNPRMTYEKMARAMRTYYRSKVLQPVPRNKNLPRKLVYRFNPALVKRVTAK